MHRVVILFDNFGPYHLARLKAAAGVCDLLAVEFGSSSSEYAWKASESEGFRRVTLNDDGPSDDLHNKEFQRRLNRVLDEFKPEAVVVPGWGYRGALFALKWSLNHDVPVICMSESTAWDEVRNPIKEWIKYRIITHFMAALVGGSAHREYMEKLGMPPDQILLGYDAIDNAYFETRTHEVQNSVPKSQASGFAASQHYFLASARFIEKKNLPRLLNAYAVYRSSVMRMTASQPWPLVIIGDGELRPELEHLRSELGLEDSVQMPGFKQYKELPEYYARAGAFIHASTMEQWGLVVNEAMASGLPVLVSKRCGCAADLVQEGGNGWTFDPRNEEEMATLMLKVASDEKERLKMGRKSLQIITEWGPARFASGLSLAIDAALSAPKNRAGLLDRLILWAMTQI